MLVLPYDGVRETLCSALLGIIVQVWLLSTSVISVCGDFSAVSINFKWMFVFRDIDISNLYWVKWHKFGGCMCCLQSNTVWGATVWPIPSWSYHRNGIIIWLIVCRLLSRCLVSFQTPVVWLELTRPVIPENFVIAVIAREESLSGYTSLSHSDVSLERPIPPKVCICLSVLYSSWWSFP